MKINCRILWKMFEKLLVCFSVCSASLITNVTGTLTSPNYPNNYDNDLHCEVNVTTSADKVSLKLFQCLKCFRPHAAVFFYVNLDETS